MRAMTWGEARRYRWNERYMEEEILMGRFVISEATRTLTVLQLKTYDYMLKFDRTRGNSRSTRTPYEWL